MTTMKDAVKVAKTEYEKYNDPANKPNDWTQEKFDTVEQAYFDLERQAGELARTVEEVEGLKTAVEDALK